MMLPTFGPTTDDSAACHTPSRLDHTLRHPGFRRMGRRVLGEWGFFPPSPGPRRLLDRAGSLVPEL